MADAVDRPWADVPADWRFTACPYRGRPAVWVEQPGGEICTIYAADDEKHSFEYGAALAEARARRKETACPKT